MAFQQIPQVLKTDLGRLQGRPPHGRWGPGGGGGPLEHCGSKIQSRARCKRSYEGHDGLQPLRPAEKPLSLQHMALSCLIFKRERDFLKKERIYLAEGSWDTATCSASQLSQPVLCRHAVLLTFETEVTC